MAIAAAHTWHQDAPWQPAATVAALDSRLAARAGLALLLVNLRYWSRVAPLARGELERWRQRALTIDDPVLRALALAKLDEEGFNAEAAAMLATLAPRAHRRRTVEAIVAAEVLYDYLDGLTESPATEARGDGERLFTAFTDAVALSALPGGDYYRHHSRSEDVYLGELVASVRLALAGLPASASLTKVLSQSAARGAEAQLRIHAATPSTSEHLRLWAERGAADTPLEWREYLAGAACSVLSVHALIAAASDRDTTYERALELDRIYLLISVLPTILDGVIDHEQDARSGRAGFVQHYDDRGLLTRRLTGVIEDAIRHARGAPDGAHHVMTLVGVIAYYFSAPTAASEFARPVVTLIARQLRPLLAPTMGMMRTWRAAKRLRERWRARPRARARADRRI
jgi:tetraprenyl-beta-curcumene synthase